MDSKMKSNTVILSDATADNPKHVEEKLEDFEDWLKIDPASEIPDFLKSLQSLGNNDSGHKDDSKNCGRGFRSRTFVNSSKHSSNDKFSKKSTVVGGFGGSWDTPVSDDTWPKENVTNKEFQMLMRKNKSENTDKSKSSGSADSDCKHLIVQTNCYCSPDCTFAVCANCFLVFCDLPCLQNGITAVGKIVASSKSSLEIPFGVSSKKSECRTNGTFTRPNSHVEQATPHRVKFEKRSDPYIEPSDLKKPGIISNDKEKLPVSAQSSNLGFGRGRGKGQSMNDRDQVDSSYRDRNIGPQKPFKKTAPPRHSQSASSTARTAPDEPSGIFRRNSGYVSNGFQEQNAVTYPEMFTTKPLLEPFQLGGKGHFEDATKQRNFNGSNGRRQVDDFETVDFIGIAIGRGKSRIPPVSPRPASLFDTNVGIGYHPNKVLRNPHGIYDTGPDVPVYRGRGRAGVTQPKKIVEESTAIRLGGNTVVSLTKPLKGAYDSTMERKDREKLNQDQTLLSEKIGLPTSPEEEEEDKVLVNVLKQIKGAEKLKTKSSSTSPKIMTEVKSDDELEISSTSEQDLKSQLEHTSFSQISMQTARDDCQNDIDCIVPQSEGAPEGEQDSDRTMRRTKDLPEVLPLLEPIDFDMNVPLNVKTCMKVTHVENIHCMYLTWTGASKHLNARRLNTNDVPKTKLEKIQLGGYCLCHHEGDILNAPGFYRGQIHEINEEEESCKVLLVDIGPLVTLQSSRLLTLPQEYYRHRRCAARFGLIDAVHKGTDANFRANEYLEKLFGLDLCGIEHNHGHKVLMQITHWGKTKQLFSTHHWGNLSVPDYENIGDIASMLISKNLALPQRNKDEFVKSHDLVSVKDTVAETKRDLQSVVIDSDGLCKTKVRICQNPISLSDFYVVIDDESSVVEEIEHFIHTSVTLGLSPYYPWLPTQGSLCLIQHPVKPNFYRGFVLCIDFKEKTHVYLLDTGETLLAELHHLKEMPETLKDYPPLAHHCSLVSTPVNKSKAMRWEEEIVQRFQKLNEIHGKGLTGLIAVVFEKIIIKRDIIHRIDLELGDEGSTLCKALEDVNQAAMCDDAVVKYVENLLSKEKLSFGRSEDINATRTFWKQKLTDYGLQLESSPIEIDSTVDKTTTELSNLMLDESGELSEFHFKRLEPTQPLYKRMGRQVSFNRVIGFDIYTLMDKLEGDQLTNELKVAIDEWAEEGDSSFGPNEKPRVNDVVMAPFGALYRRAKVEMIQTNVSAPLALVRFLEHGNASKVAVSALKKPNKRLMEIPQIVTVVKLENMEDHAPILVTHFRKLREELSSTAIVGEIVPQDPLAMRRSNCPTVRLYVEAEDIKRQPLSKLVNDLAIWKWRRLYRAMYGHYDDLEMQYRWTNYSIESFFKESTITSTIKRRTLSMKIRKTSLDGDRLMLIGIPHDDTITYQSRTLNLQMTMFMNKVDVPDFKDHEVIIYHHIVAFTLSKERLSADKYPTLCSTWHRGYYNKEVKRLICVDCFWIAEPEKGEQKFPGLTIRPLPPDFYDACPGVLSCDIDVSFLDPSLQKLEYLDKFFPVGREVTVNLEGRDCAIKRGFFSYKATCDLNLTPKNKPKPDGKKKGGRK